MAPPPLLPPPPQTVLLLLLLLSLPPLIKVLLHFSRHVTSLIQPPTPDPSPSLSVAQDNAQCASPSGVPSSRPPQGEWTFCDSGGSGNFVAEFYDISCYYLCQRHISFSYLYPTNNRKRTVLMASKQEETDCFHGL